MTEFLLDMLEKESGKCSREYGQEQESVSTCTVSKLSQTLTSEKWAVFKNMSPIDFYCTWTYTKNSCMCVQHNKFSSKQPYYRKIEQYGRLNQIELCKIRTGAVLVYIWIVRPQSYQHSRTIVC